jgi:DNA-binding NarL/FixJ family response regulator
MPVLCGAQQKWVAPDLGIAYSTASKRYTNALKKLGLAPGPVPLPLVLAAQASASGREPAVAARATSFEHEQTRYVLLSVHRPSITDGSLTTAERAVAERLIEGATRAEIARERSTSVQTIACQSRNIFFKCRISGRHSLVARGAELGWYR